MQIRTMIALATLSALSTLASAQDVLGLLQQAQGRWEGTLAYRDYGSDQRANIPAVVELEPLADGDQMLRRMTFLDPRRDIQSSEVVTVSEDSKTIRSVSFEGREVAVSEYRVASVDDLGAEGWRLVVEGSGIDNGQNVSVRTTTIYSIDRLTQTHEYRSENDAAWQWRNEVVLDRVDATDASRLVRAWTVDLRPTPDAPPALAPMVIDSVDDGNIVGTFYGTQIEMGRVNTDWGAVRFAFVTRDGSGPYATMGMLLPGGSVSGMTLSTGRKFLSVWTGEADD